MHDSWRSAPRVPCLRTVKRMYLAGYDEFIDANRKNWNDRAKLHLRSSFYDVPGFLAGRSTLEEYQLREVGDVSGKRLLHLQCHIGLDTLSWARLGAEVTGVDISDEAIQAARSLAAELKLSARFIESNVFDLPDQLAETFDVVYATEGVLFWIPDMGRWASVAAHFVKPGGFLYLADGHPLANVLKDDEPAFDPSYSYFHSSDPSRGEYHGSYVAETAVFDHPVSYGWQHHLGEIVTSVIDSGLQLELLHEYPFAAFHRLPQMKSCEDGLWRLPGDRLPFIFSLRAWKPAGLSQ